MATAIKVIDAFKLNQAPYMLQDTLLGERKVYLAEAYTETYMIRSVKTGQLCRYVVETEKGFVSAFGLFRITPTTNEVLNWKKLMLKMDKETLYGFLKAEFGGMLTSFKAVTAFCDQYNSFKKPVDSNPMYIAIAESNLLYNALYNALGV